MANRIKPTEAEAGYGPNVTAVEELWEEEAPADRPPQGFEACIPSAEKEQEIPQQRQSSDPREQILALYDEYRPRLFRYMRSMHLGRDRADEVIQETFMRFTAKILEGSDIENVQGWIVRVAHNLALDLLKEERKAAAPSESITFVIENRVDPALSPEEAYSNKERIQRMESTLSSLKPQQRQCFQLRAQGFRYKDIGLALGVSEQRAAFIVRQVAVHLAAACG